MPWKVIPEGNQFKVYKLDADNKPTGKPVGTFGDKAKAEAQVRALYASEKKPAKEATVTVTDSGGNSQTFATDTVTSSGGEMTTYIDSASIETKEYYESEVAMMPTAGPCSWDEMEAMETAHETAEKMQDLTYKFQRMANHVMRNQMIEDKAGALVELATGLAERVKRPESDDEKEAGWTGEQLKSDMGTDDRPKELKAVWSTKFVNDLPSSSFLYVEPDCDNKGCRHLPYKDASGKIDLPHLRNAIARIPQMKGISAEKKASLQAKARKLLEDADKKELFIWKEGDTYRWMAAYSNNRRDDDSPPEIISTESHKEFDTALHKGEWPMPEIWLWHIPYPVGTTQYHAFDESTGFPVAAGIFNKGYEWAAEGIMQAGWNGVSHGMPDAWIKRDDKDKSIIVRHRTKEITFLPLWAAANKLAFSIISKEASMSDEKGLPAHKRAEFITAFGEEKVKQMEDTLEDKSKAADEAGIQKKEETPPAETPAAPALTPDSEIVKALGLVMDTLSTLGTRIKALEDGVTEVKEKQAADEPFDLMEFLKSKSAIGAHETKVDGRTTLAKDGPTETPQAVARPGGLNLTVVDELMGINQAWAEKRGMN